MKFANPCITYPSFYSGSTSKTAAYIDHDFDDGTYITHIYLKSLITGHLEKQKFSSENGHLQFLGNVANRLLMLFLKQESSNIIVYLDTENLQAGFRTVRHEKIQSSDKLVMQDEKTILNFEHNHIAGNVMILEIQQEEG